MQKQPVKGQKKPTVNQMMKAAQKAGKQSPDYDPVVYYGDLLWT